MVEKFSQNNEEAVIGEIFSGVTGRLLDIGAYVPGALSNTRALMDKGWEGVFVEPSPGPFKDLLDYYGGNPRASLVNCAIGLTPGLTAFYDSSGDAVSTASEQHKAKWEHGAGSKYRKYWLKPLSVTELFDHFGYDFDLVSLDVEGLNWEIFQALPFSRLQAKVICVEHDFHQTEMGALVEAHGYTAVALNGENVIFSR